MAFFTNPFKPQSPPVPKVQPVQAPPVPAQLPKISAPTAAQIAQHSQLSPAAQALLTPQQTPAQHLQALQDYHLGNDMVKTLAHGMPDRDGVHWATQSAEKVSDKLPAEDVHAMKAAQAWVKSPTPANKAAAGAAAAKTNFSGPGAWAAQGAAWSQPSAPADSGAASGAAALPRMTPHAVTASVLMSSSIHANPALAAPKAQVPSLKAPTAALPSLKAPQVAPPQAPQAPAPTVPPAVQAHAFQQQHPFIAMGLSIASGKSPLG